MTRPETVAEPLNDAEEAVVLDYLARAPEFFMRHTELLETLAIPHGAGGASSLIERQVKVLRDKNQKLNDRLEDLLHTARENEARVAGLNRLAESLIQADSLAAVVVGLTQALLSEFAVESVKLALFQRPEGEAGADCVELVADELPPSLSDFFRQKRVYCDVMTDELRATLFADHQELHSVALVPLDRHDCLGLLAMASTDKERFTPAMGQMFLEMTANLCAAALRFHGARVR